MPQLTFPQEIESIILDIEGTICPISFVHDKLFPFFLSKLEFTLSKYEYPVTPSDDISQAISEFPSFKTRDELSLHIHSLVDNDIKDPVLKKFQGLVWLQGYQSGELSSPIYEDVIKLVQYWHSLGKSVYIYSSGSVKAQKLILQYNDSSIDLNQYVTDYFDTINIGSKLEEISYQKIASTVKGNLLFLSDNINELELGEKHVNCCLVFRLGNKPAEYKRKITTFDDLI